MQNTMRYNAHLQVAVDEQDCNRCLDILKKMLPAMKQRWNLQNHPLYRFAKDEGGSLFLSSRIADSFCMELSSKEEYAFLRGCTDFEKLLIQVRN